jgi:hypothetical protein
MKANPTLSMVGVGRLNLFHPLMYLGGIHHKHNDVWPPQEGASIGYENLQVISDANRLDLPKIKCERLVFEVSKNTLRCGVASYSSVSGKLLNIVSKTKELPPSQETNSSMAFCPSGFSAAKAPKFFAA